MAVSGIHMGLVYVSLLGFSSLFVSSFVSGLIGGYSCLLFSLVLFVGDFEVVVGCVLTFVLGGLFMFVLEVSSEDVFVCVIICVGFTLVSSATDLLRLYIGVELQSVGLYVLVSRGSSSYVSEIGLKYLVVSSVGSVLFVLGIAEVYSQGGMLVISELSFTTIGYSVGFIVVGLGLCVKLGLFPFYMYLVDVSDGSSQWVNILLSSGIKLSFMFIVFSLGLGGSWLFKILGGFSIIVGLVGCLQELKLSRFVAYSGLVHVGYVIISGSLNGAFGYLSTYMSTVCVFLYILDVCGCVFVDELGKYTSFGTRLFLLLVLLIMAGIPPFVGFDMKYEIILGLWFDGYVVLVTCLLVGVIVGGLNYLRIGRQLYYTGTSVLTEFVNVPSSLMLGLFLSCVWAWTRSYGYTVAE